MKCCWSRYGMVGWPQRRRSRARPGTSTGFEIRPGAAGRLQRPAGDLLRCRHLDVPRQPQRFHEADEDKAGIELEPAQPERSRIGKGVMIVVPALAPGQPGHDAEIAAVVLARG